MWSRLHRLVAFEVRLLNFAKMGFRPSRVTRNIRGFNIIAFANIIERGALYISL